MFKNNLFNPREGNVKNSVNFITKLALYNIKVRKWTIDLL